MIRFSGVSFGYRSGLDVLRDVNLEVPPGLNLLLGPNGCGKSTLLKIAAGVEKPAAGSVSVFGRDLWREEIAARSHLAYLPEHPDLSPYATVAEILTMVAGLRGQPKASVHQALEWVGLEGLEDRTVRELSMGQRRRAVLAASRIGTPECLLLDEPLEAMDRSFRSLMIGWLTDLRDRGATLLVVSHEIDSFAPIADRAVTVLDGRAVLVESLGEHRATASQPSTSLHEGSNFAVLRKSPAKLTVVTRCDPG